MNYIIDAMCGAGKTTSIFAKMKEWQELGSYEQFVYISPLLSEVGGDTRNPDTETIMTHPGRINDPEVCAVNFQQPTHPHKTRKAAAMLKHGDNVSATHTLFLGLDPETLDSLEQQRNVLVIDEAMEVVSVYTKIKAKNIKFLLASGILKVNPKTKQVSWDDSECPEDGTTGTDFEDVRKQCDAGTLYLASNKKLLVWSFPPEILKAFTDVYILTYGFQHSLLKQWMDKNEMGFTIITLCMNLKKTNQEIIRKAKELITLVHTPNATFPNKALTQYWYGEATGDEIEEIRSACELVMKHHMRIGGEEKNGKKTGGIGLKVSDVLVTCPKVLWRTPKEAAKANSPQKYLKGKGYARADWLASDTKATNDYGDKHGVMYLLNKHPKVPVTNTLSALGLSLNRDGFALNSLIQFVWRSAIRKEEPIVVYIASVRMRLLFMLWLGYTREEALQLGYNQADVDGLKLNWKAKA